jgi:hypothetical protein
MWHLYLLCCLLSFFSLFFYILLPGPGSLAPPDWAAVALLVIFVTSIVSSIAFPSFFVGVTLLLFSLLLWAFLAFHWRCVGPWAGSGRARMEEKVFPQVASLYSWYRHRWDSNLFASSPLR